MTKTKKKRSQLPPTTPRSRQRRWGIGLLFTLGAVAAIGSVPLFIKERVHDLSEAVSDYFASAREQKRRQGAVDLEVFAEVGRSVMTAEVARRNLEGPKRDLARVPELLRRATPSRAAAEVGRLAQLLQSVKGRLEVGFTDVLETDFVRDCELVGVPFESVVEISRKDCIAQGISTSLLCSHGMLLYNAIRNRLLVLAASQVRAAN